MIDMKKKYRTRDGREVRLYAVDGRGDLSVHGAIKVDKGWECRCWYSHGGMARNEVLSLDLIEIKPSAIDQMIEYLQDRREHMEAVNFGELARIEIDQAIIKALRIKAESGDE